MPTAATLSQAVASQLLAGLMALRQGDFSHQLPSDLDGLEGKLADTFNDVIAMNQRMALELERISHAVGRQGRLSQRASVGDVRGSWEASMVSVNTLIDDLVHPTTEMARVIGAVAKGDLSQTMALETDGRPLEGEFRRTAITVNTMVDQLGSFASEVTRVAREVGTEGKLAGQAQVRGVAGTWKDLTDNVNLMAGNLTAQVRNIAEVTTAVANGDLTKKIAVDVKGEFLELKNTINTMVDQLRSFASEVTRVAREVGTEGKLGGQAQVEGVSGTWKDLTDSVNSMAGNLTSQVRNIAAVTTAVARGDLSKQITVDVQGEMLELKNTVNTMVDQLSSFAAEVTRVAREVGTEGKLGGQARVAGVSGTWKDLTDSVNSMAGNLTSQVRNIAAVTTAVAGGDLTKKITVDVQGEILELKNTVNTMVDQLSSFAAEVTRVAREVGTEGKLGGQAEVPGVDGTWKDLTDNVNLMASNLTVQLRDVSKVATAIATGDLTQKVTVDVRGEILQIKNVINTMVDQLRSFAAEVTRVAREVGTEGKLGGQAQVQGVAGTWKDLTDNVNLMAGNLTAQVRGIARVVTAVAGGDLTRKLTVEAEGEIAALSDTINGMIETLATFADQVTSVAFEVGVEGKLGGQASVPGAAGTWKDLTDNVNRLAANLTTQVRAIAEVATAVTTGDLTRSIQVEAQGEVAALKDNINYMIGNLKDTTLKNAEQDWLKTNLAKFSRMLQGQRDLLTVGRLVLSELAPVVSAQQGVLYVLDSTTSDGVLRLLAGYAHKTQTLGDTLRLGEGLIGQCAMDRRKIQVDRVPGEYLKVSSGLGEATPQHLVVLPILFEGQVKGVLELASFEQFNPTHHAFLDQLTESIGIVLHTIEANTRTEDLLEQSQSLAHELQFQQQELQLTNQQLEEKAKLLAEQNVEVERKSSEVEQARQALEEKAKQLALTSRFKSEFLANMSHELRTPLNSLLILSDQLSKNPAGNLTGKQVQFAQTIHASGNDLLTLINDILDLSKIESGTVAVDIEDYNLEQLRRYVDRTFRHIAEAQRLDFAIDIDARLPKTFETDPKRLQQVLKNLLSNAFKFTARGSVQLSIQTAHSGWSQGQETLDRARSVLAIAVRDTGIGIPPEKQHIIFEAFQQADGSTSRKYGGTGLGLAISRELARLLGGELTLASAPEQGSTFTLYLPQSYTKARGRKSPADAVVEAIPQVAPTPAEEPAAPLRALSAPLVDDRDMVGPQDRVLLVVDNDHAFSGVMADLAHDHGFKVLTTAFGAAALALARERQPDAITLDISLPDFDGWRVLDRLKHDLDTRHIPVFVITTDEERERSFSLGAAGVLNKPVHTREQLEVVFQTLARVTRPEPQHALVLARGQVVAELRHLCGDAPVTIEAIEWEQADARLAGQSVDCLVVDAADAERAFASLPAEATTALVVYAPSGLAPELSRDLRRQTLVRPVRVSPSIERLFDDLALVLHLRPHQLPAHAREVLDRRYRGDAVLAGRKVLIVDDDIRNIFAMTSVLETHQMQVVAAENGKEGIEKLQATAGIDIVLMDIMMPDMDGYDTMRAIRGIPKFRSLPIVAVTAKAMKGDREKCIEAGAWDYLPKPVASDQLLSVFRTWLHR